jgi:NAD(P)-dependent dehydrogenase (short-subunit alcohol dehydrogenase family)
MPARGAGAIPSWHTWRADVGRKNDAVAGELDGIRVLVTGASSGVGLAASRRFVEEGAAVAMLARRADRLAALAGELGERAHAFPVDVADAVAVASAVAAAGDVLGGLDLAVNAAGSVVPAELAELDPDLWHQVIDVNLSGTFYVAREAALRMRADGGGAIVNVGSDLASYGLKEFAHYCAAKAGVVGLTRALAAELAPSVRVNVVCPGPIDTPMMDTELALTADPAAERAQAIERVALKRFMDPGEVVAAIRFLAFDAPFATGAVLPLDAGATAF